MMRYVLGVDGGNSKTDYLLHGEDGRLVGHLRGGTCSHERLGLEGAYEEMDARIAALLSTANIRRKEVAAAAFGLAGVDQTSQKHSLEAVVRRMGFENSIVMNDSFLGIKAGSETGTGICSINGTGTAAGGIDSRGTWVQVGGYGETVSGDMAGGSYIARRTLGAAYDAAYRFGKQTELLPRMVALLGCGSAENFHEAVSVEYLEGRKTSALSILRELFAACDAGDGVAVDIVREVADALARSAAGCAVRLVFEGAVPVVLIGSVWTKGRHPLMMDEFARRFEQYAQKRAELHILVVPPAAGSVIWALELVEGRLPSQGVRNRVIEETKGLHDSP